MVSNCTEAIRKGPQATLRKGRVVAVHLLFVEIGNLLHDRRFGAGDRSVRLRQPPQFVSAVHKGILRRQTC